MDLCDFKIWLNVMCAKLREFKMGSFRTHILFHDQYDDPQLRGYRMYVALGLIYLVFTFVRRNIGPLCSEFGALNLNYLL
jgi:hypothetical protein